MRSRNDSSRPDENHGGSRHFRLPVLSPNKETRDAEPKRKKPSMTQTRTNPIILWSLFMSVTEICLILFQNTYNEVVAILYLILAGIGILLDKFVVARSTLQCSSIKTGGVATLHLLLLSSVLAMITAVNRVQEKIDRIAWKFLVMNKSESEMMLGSIFTDPMNYVYFMGPILFESFLIVSIIGLIVKLICSQTTTLALHLQKSCQFFLSGVLVLASFILQNYMLSQTEDCSSISAPGACTEPPPVKFQQKPNIVVLLVDSWRRDIVDEDTMPKTLGWLQEDKPGLTHVEWKKHDSAAIISEEAVASLFYSMFGLSREKLIEYTRHSTLKSWNLQTFRNNDYDLHRVTSFSYDFCWFIMQSCPIFTRDFDYRNGVNASLIPDVIDKKTVWPYVSSQLVYDEVFDLLKQQQELPEKDRKPLFVAGWLQDIHYPYRAGKRPNVTYHFPEIEEKVLEQFTSGREKLTTENRAEYIFKLRNKIKNCLINLDLDLEAWLRKIQPYMNDTLFILTGDHAELYFDVDDHIGHGAPNPSDAQRAVPMHMVGPTNIVSSLQVEQSVVTSHVDVLPSVMEALVGGELGPKWTEQVHYHSQYNRHSNPMASKGFTYNSGRLFSLLIEGNKRLVINEQGDVQQAHYLENVGDQEKDKQLSQEQIDQMKKVIDKMGTSNWPGMDSTKWEPQCKEGTIGPPPPPPKHEINARNHFCGTDWYDAFDKCGTPCPSKKDMDCPDDEKCWGEVHCIMK